MEIKEEVKTYRVKLMCDTKDCTGEMLPDGRCLMSNPPQYPHVCNVCGNTDNVFGKKYPYTVCE